MTATVTIYVVMLKNPTQQIPIEAYLRKAEAEAKAKAIGTDAWVEGIAYHV